MMAGMISARMISVGMISVGILRRVVAALTAIALLMLTGAVHAAPPVEPDKPDFVVLNRDVAPLSPRLRQAVLLDPKVAEATARACQLTHRLGLARAAGRPKVNASISGTRQIKSKIKEIPSLTRVTENGRPRLVKPRGYDEIEETGAHTREFDHDEKNNIYDGKVSVRHTFIDWGQRSNRTEARTLALQAARIDALGVMRERSHEILRLALLLRRTAEVIAVRQDNFKAVQTEVASVRARVEAGHEPRAALLSARARHHQETGAAELARLAADARRADLVSKRREIESAMANFRAGAAEALVEEQTKAAQLLARQDALRGKVRHADVRAPLRGTVSAVHVKTVGAVVQAGTMLAEIVPAEARYLVRAQGLPQNVKDVQPGQVARISLAAYDPSRYGVIMGIVRQVAGNTTQPENAMPFYETIIAIPEVAFTKSPETPVITAGMPLQVDILGGKRTIMNYIMTPIQKSLATAFREK